MWLPLKRYGVAPFRAALEEKLLLAQYFYENIQQLDGYEVGPEPDLSIVTFRYVPKTGDANEFNRLLTERIRADGRVLLSSTTIEGRYTHRVAVLGNNTHLETIQLTLQILEEQARELLEAA